MFLFWRVCRPLRWRRCGPTETGIDVSAGGNLDARLLLTLPLDGLYTLLATTYSREEGPYALLVREFRPLAVRYVPLPNDRRVHAALTDSDASRSDTRKRSWLSASLASARRRSMAIPARCAATWMYSRSAAVGARGAA